MENSRGKILRPARLLFGLLSEAPELCLNAPRPCLTSPFLLFRATRHRSSSQHQKALKSPINLLTDGPREEVRFAAFGPIINGGAEKGVGKWKKKFSWMANSIAPGNAASSRHA
ncbi:hypothetical protein [Erythrobacter sp.]|uniref:hypothetical protein n=1 Tax=Erythrobacter sp. TaxID=1042 RepID=UPI00261F9919|nr:hypothetical protein [Erythrobacter sp.]